MDRQFAFAREELARLRCGINRNGRDKTRTSLVDNVIIGDPTTKYGRFKR